MEDQNQKPVDLRPIGPPSTVGGTKVIQPTEAILQSVQAQSSVVAPEQAPPVSQQPVIQDQQAVVVSQQTNETPQFVSSSPENIIQPKSKGKRNVIIIGIVVAILLLAGVTSAILINSSHSDNKPKAQSASQSKTVAATPKKVEQQTQAAPAPPQYSPYPAAVQTAFINNCTSLGNKLPSCTCDINWIENHYTLAQYQSISTDPNSMAYENMTAGAYDNYNCVP